MTGRIQLKVPNLRDVSYVTGNLRPLDKIETFCQLPESMTTTELAGALMVQWEGGTDMFVAHCDKVPAMVFGMTPLTVCHAAVWAIGTKAARRTAPAVTRFIRDELIPDWEERGFRSMEARSLAEHRTAHGWMERTGAVRLCELPRYGRNGETFCLYYWLSKGLKDG